MITADPSVAELAHHVQQWADAAALEFGARVAELAHAAPSAFDLMPPAYAADAPAAPVLDPNVQYVFGADGNVLIDPMTNKPITDDWWNSLIGFQTDLIKGLDGQLRAAGVQEAFGWSIVLYTLFVKVVFYPLQQGQLKSTSMMQLLSPKVKEIQERYKNDPETQQRLIGQMYQAMDVNPLGGCLPTLLQLPLFWSLYGVWRRLSAEKFPYYTESFLWVPSLGKPNPDFQWKLDWLWEFQNGQPVMGWHDYLCYLIFPGILVGYTLYSSNQTKAMTQGKEKDGEKKEDSNLFMEVLPYISTYLIGCLTLELPQAVAVYYATNTFSTVVQTNLVKDSLRKEIPGYEEFERTGKFPDSAFDEAVMASVPPPTTLHEAAVRGNVQYLREFIEGDEAKGIPAGQFPINAWDEKEIAPIGYAVACGHLEAVRYLLEKGASLDVLDGQKNTLLHYAAGYGHKDVLVELIDAGAKVWPDNKWSELRNAKNQTIMDAARVNRKGGVIDYLCDRLGIDAAEVLTPAPERPEDVEVVQTKKAVDTPAKARAALLAMATGKQPEPEVEVVQQPSAPSSPPSAEEAQKAAGSIRDTVARLKANPEAVEKARSMMKMMPPQLLSTLFGNKLSPEQAQKAIEQMDTMSTEDLLKSADGAAEMLAKGDPRVAGTVGAAAAAAAKAKGKAVPARSVD